MNRIFLCEDKKNGHKVLLRLYGGKVMEGNDFLKSGGFDREVLVFYTMANMGIAPQLYGVFPDGRLEEYVNGHQPTREDYEDEQLMSAFARKLARVHATRLPLTKSPRDYFTDIHEAFKSNWDTYVQHLKEMPHVPGSDEAANLVYNYDIFEILIWFRDTFPKIKHKIILMHGDMNSGNVLIRNNVTNPDDKIVLLDYEFTSYSYRGFDIGNHFQSRTLDILQLLSAGKLVNMPYPNEEKRRQFVRAYIEELKRQPDYVFDVSLDNEYQILLEAEFFGAVYDQFLNAWLIGAHETFHSVFKDFPLHPVTFMARTIRNAEERKKSVIELMKRAKLD